MARAAGALAPDGRALSAPGLELSLLRVADAGELFAALDDERVWASGYGGGPAARPRDVAAMEDFVAAMISRPGQRQYALRIAAAFRGVDGSHGPGETLPAALGTLVGTSGLGDLDLTNENVHLGWTAYAPSVWSTSVNPAAKLALLSHAFDDCGLRRVKIQTDTINLRSQAAIGRLGAVKEGVLRAHKRRADGTWRDTVVFSILADEWPGVRGRLEQRLAAPTAG